jgi:hypothetical protein
VIQRTIRSIRALEFLLKTHSLLQQSRRFCIIALLDLMFAAFMGVFFTLETATVPDLLEIEGVKVFDEWRIMDLDKQAQLCWFIALTCSALEGCIVLASGIGSTSVQATGSTSKTASEPRERRLKLKKLLTDCLDMLLPAATLGFVPLDLGLLGLIMLATTILTSTDILTRLKARPD